MPQHSPAGSPKPPPVTEAATPPYARAQAGIRAARREVDTVKGSTATTAIAIAVAALVVAACGGDDDGGGRADTSTSASDPEILVEEADLGTGTAKVTIDGTTFAVDDAELCLAEESDFQLEGLGRGTEGEDGWVTIVRTTSSRDELLTAFDEEFVDALLDGADSYELASVTVEVGRTERNGPVSADLPYFSATTDGTSGSLTFTAEGPTMEGSGEVTDLNGVLLPYGETVAFEFSATCG